MGFFITRPVEFMYDKKIFSDSLDVLQLFFGLLVTAGAF